MCISPGTTSATNRPRVYEGAVSAALQASAQYSADHGAAESASPVQVPPVWPRGLLVLARLLLIPIVAMARAIAWVEELVAPRRHEVVKAPLQVESKPRHAEARLPNR